MSAARKTAVVTGGAGFIGSHMVDLLVERGYRVRIIDNLVGGREANIAHHAGNADVVAEIREAGGEATAMQADVRKSAEVQRLFEKA